MKKSSLLLIQITLFFLGCISVSYGQVVFKNVSDSAGISAPNSQSYSFSSIWVDIDNDDYLDLYVAHGSGNGNEFNQLFHNLRNGKFKDIRATAFPAANPAYTGQMCWGDFNNDGFIDCYESHFPTTDDWLWLNNGDMTFKDARNLFVQPGLYATGAIFSDINSDGKLDLLINTQAFQGTSIELNNGHSFDLIKPFFNGGQGDEILATYINDDSIPDYMFGNARGMDSLFFSSQSGGFVGFDNSFLKTVRQLSDYPGAAAFADIDNDGYPDLLVHYPNKLFVFHDIQGKSFVDWTHELGLDSAKNGTHITIFFYDFDNDGYLDLFLLNEDAVSQIYYGSPTGFKSPTNLPMNNPPTGGLHNASLTDYDNDGFIDIQHNGVGKVELWHNEGNSNRWLNIKLRGHQANSNGIGARVIAYSDGRRQNREVGYTQGNYGYLPLMAHFGFGTSGCVGSGVIDSVVVIWQPGGRQVIKNVRYNELAVIDQDSGIVRTIERPLSSSFGFANPYFLSMKSVYADTLVSMPMAVNLPKNFVAASLLADEITFTIGYNSDVIDISATKVGVRYTPPAGWTFKSSAMSKDSLSITITNSGGQLLSDSVGLGTLTFDTYKANVKGTYIYLSAIIVHAKGNDYAFCHNFEGDFLGEVVVVNRPTSGVSQDEKAGWDLSISPNPVTGNSVTARCSIGLIGHIELSVFDVLGKEVWHSGSDIPLNSRSDILLNSRSDIPVRQGETDRNVRPTNVSIPTSQLSGGVYLVRGNIGGRILTGKFTVVR